MSDPKEYLRSSGWYNIYDDLWVDLTMRCCITECHESVAILVQKLIDQHDALPWYKKFIKKIFRL